jgi:hypothetical protein
MKSYPLNGRLLQASLQLAPAPSLACNRIIPQLTLTNRITGVSTARPAAFTTACRRVDQVVRVREHFPANYEAEMAVLLMDAGVLEDLPPIKAK